MKKEKGDDRRDTRISISWETSSWYAYTSCDLNPSARHLRLLCSFFPYSPFLLLFFFPERLSGLDYPGPRRFPILLIMAVPCNIRGSASQLFYQDQQCPQYQALLAITEMPHPDRSIVGAFLMDARNPQEAARYFLRETAIDGTSHSVPARTISEFLSDWKYLVSMCKHVIVISKQVYLASIPDLRSCSSAYCSNRAVRWDPAAGVWKRRRALLPHTNTIQVTGGFWPALCTHRSTTGVDASGFSRGGKYIHSISCGLCWH